MKLSALLVLPLIQGILAAGFTGFNVPYLRTVSDNGRNRTTVRFVFEDLNTNATATCTAAFPRNATDGQIILPDTYISCGGEPRFSWRLENFESVHNFQLELRRSFRLASVGPPGMDQVTLFGYRNITEGSDYRCRTSSYTEVTRCRTPSNSTLYVPVTGAIA